MFLPDHLEADRKRTGFTVGQVAYRVGVSPAEYRRVIDGAPITSYDTWQRICDLYGWPQTFAGTGPGSTKGRTQGRRLSG